MAAPQNSSIATLPGCKSFHAANHRAMICTPFTGQLVKGDFLCAIPMNAKNIALTCIGKGNILKHLKAFPKGVFAWWSADGAEVKKRNRVWTTEERFELVNRVLSGESFTSVAISAGICPGGLNTWIHKYKGNGIYWPYKSKEKSKAKGVSYEETQAYPTRKTQGIRAWGTYPPEIRNWILQGTEWIL